jgi:hypothetical protein
VAKESHQLPEGVSAHAAGGPDFLGQQAGAAADLLQAEFGAALAMLPQVERAYFCKLKYPGAERASAVVCVVCKSGEDLRVVEALAAVIRTNLGSGSHIDVLFLSPSLEGRLAKVCQPFYKQSEPGATHDGGGGP